MALKRNRSFPLSTLRPCPDKWSRKNHGTPTARRRGASQRRRSRTPQVPADGGALRRSQSSLGALCREELPPAPPQKVPTRLCSTPALTAHSTRGGTERGYHSRSRSTVWELCYTDLSIMILGSPIQGIRCRPCSWY